MNNNEPEEQQPVDPEPNGETYEYTESPDAPPHEAPLLPPPAFRAGVSDAQPAFRPQPRVVKRAAPVAKSGSGAWVSILFILGSVGAVVWFFSRPKPPAPVVKDEPEAAPIVEVVKPTPEPQVAKATPEPVKPKEVVMTPAPTPAPPVPTPTPAPVVVAKPTLDWKTPLSLDAVAARSAAAVDRYGNTLRAAADQSLWAEYNALLVRSMAAELSRSPDYSSAQRYNRFFENPVFMRALLQHGILKKMDSAFQSRIASEPQVQQFVIRLLESSETLESLLVAMTPKNDLSRVLGTMALLADGDADVFGKYRDLAVACAVVMQQPISFQWNDARYTASAMERYRWFKTKDVANDLAVRLNKLNAWQLAWVVSVPVSTEEMDWAVAHMRRKYKQGDWGRAYNDVEYDMQYAVKQVRKKPYDGYLFAEILEKGGICGDRAYFSAHTARANGIPAIEISGDGPRGPHAWMAWLADEDRWETSGRFDGYPSGRVRDPRNDESISEQVFDRLSGSGAPKGSSLAMSRRLMWLADVQNAAGQAQAAEVSVEYALRTTPREPSAWLRKLEVWSKRQPAPTPADWKVFLDAFRRAFPGDTDLLAQVRNAEDRYLLAKMDSTAVKKELTGDIRDLNKLKGLTSVDEIRAAYKRPADILAKAKDMAGVRKLYRDALDDYGREPAKFKAIGNDYWTYVQTDPVAKQQACRDIEGAFEHHVKTRGGDYFDVQSQNTAAEFVAQCWRAAGDEKRADKFEKEIAKRAATATKATRVKTP